MLMHTNRIEFLDLQFDRATFEQVKAWLRSVTPAKPYGYVVTPNVDLTVRAHREQGLSQLYSDADLCVCDSRDPPPACTHLRHQAAARPGERSRGNDAQSAGEVGGHDCHRWQYANVSEPAAR